MHCAELTSLKGIDLFTNLTELNVSSNNLLAMSGIEQSTQLTYLNLSCNQI